MQPYLFPYIGYFQLIEKVDKFIFFDNVNYIKKGFVNRNYFVLNGELKRISFPVKKVSQNRFINQHFYEQQACLKLELLVSLCPQLKSVVTKLTEMINALENVARVNGFAITAIAKSLGLDTDFYYASDLITNWDPNTHNSGEDKILSICKNVGASEYINPSNGINLYNRKIFSGQGVVLKSFSHELNRLHEVHSQGQSMVSLLANLELAKLVKYSKQGKCEGV